MRSTHTSGNVKATPKDALAPNPRAFQQNQDMDNSVHDQTQDNQHSWGDGDSGTDKDARLEFTIRGSSTYYIVTLRAGAGGALQRDVRGASDDDGDGWLLHRLGVYVHVVH